MPDLNLKYQDDFNNSIIDAHTNIVTFHGYANENTSRLRLGGFYPADANSYWGYYPSLGGYLQTSPIIYLNFLEMPLVIDMKYPWKLEFKQKGLFWNSIFYRPYCGIINTLQKFHMWRLTPLYGDLIIYYMNNSIPFMDAWWRATNTTGAPLPSSGNPWIYQIFYVPAAFGISFNFLDHGGFTLNPGYSRFYYSTNGGTSYKNIFYGYLSESQWSKTLEYIPTGFAISQYTDTNYDSGNYSDWDYIKFWQGDVIPPVESDIDLQGMLLIAKDVLRLDFTGNLAATRTYFETGTYSIVGINCENPVVLEVLPAYARSTNYIFLKIRNLQYGKQYRISFTPNKLFDIQGKYLTVNPVVWRMHRTKVDNVVYSLPQSYNRQERSNLRGVIEAIMISDEIIGGDF